jgi:hypothetical protein
MGLDLAGAVKRMEQPPLRQDADATRFGEVLFSGAAGPGKSAREVRSSLSERRE